MCDTIEESRQLINECRVLLAELERVLLESISRSDIAKYKRLIENLRQDNERLFRENVLLKDALYNGK